MSDAPAVLGTDFIVEPLDPGMNVEYFDPDAAAGFIESVLSQFKKGFKTTEFWASVVTTVIIVASDKVFGVKLSGEQVIGLAGSAMTYIASRTWLKTQRLRAIS